MKAKKVYEFRTSGEIVKMGPLELIKRWFQNNAPEYKWDFSKELGSLLIAETIYLEFVKFKSFPYPKVYILNSLNDTSKCDFKFPEELKVQESFNLRCSNPPKRLEAKILSYDIKNNNTKLPDYFKVDQLNLNEKFTDNELQNINPDSIFNTLRFTTFNIIENITKFPPIKHKDFKVLNLKYTNISELPENIQVSKLIIGKQFETLPKGLTVRILDLYHADFNKFKKIPEDIKILHTIKIPKSTSQEWIEDNIIWKNKFMKI